MYSTVFDSFRIRERKEELRRNAHKQARPKKCHHGVRSSVLEHVVLLRHRAYYVIETRLEFQSDASDEL